MYEKVKSHLKESGFKKYNTSTFITVRDDMMFSISPQGVKNDLNVWYAIHPLALPNLWVNMGWTPAAGSFPQADGKYTSIPYEQGNIESAMINEINANIFTLFKECTSLENLESLYNQGNFRARYPQAFTLLAMKQYEKGALMLEELSNSFKKTAWGTLEKDIVYKYLEMQKAEEIDTALESERINNIKKHKLVNYIKNANKAPLTAP